MRSTTPTGPSGLLAAARRGLALGSIIGAGLAALVGSGGGGGGDTTPPPPASVTVSGVADYASVPPNTATAALNYAGTTFKPIRGATVEAVAVSGGAVLGTTTTSASGNYSLTLASPPPFVVRVKAEMKRTAATGGQWDFTVRDNTASGALYVLDSASITPTTATIAQPMRANSGWGGSSYTSTRAAAPFAILDVVYNATQKILSASPNANFPALKLFWSVNNRPASGNLANGDIGTSHYRFTNTGHESYILGLANTDTDEYDTHVVAHEWGHYFQQAFSRSDSTGGPHATGDRLDMRLAFGEGWGNAWSGMAMGTPIYTDSCQNAQASGCVRQDLNAAPTVNPGWFSESSVQYLLWNFHNNAAIGFGPIFTAMTGGLRTEPSWVGIHAFAHHLKAAVPGQAGAINALLAGQSIVAQDALGTGETNSGGITGAAAVLPVYKTHTAALGATQNYCVTNAASAVGEFPNKLGAYVFIRFTLAASGSRTITATMTGGVGDPDFEVLQSDGTTKRVFESTTPGVETGTLTLPAGTHTLALIDFDIANIPGARCIDLRIQ
jgi:hypothetical protein